MFIFADILAILIFFNVNSQIIRYLDIGDLGVFFFFLPFHFTDRGSALETPRN